MKTWIFLSLVAFSSAMASDALANYLVPGDVRIDEVIAPPPTPRSAQDESDHQELLRLQASRTAADCERANSEADIGLEGWFGSPRGPLTAAEIGRWSDFFDKIQADAKYFSSKAKKQWKRPRPYVSFSDIHPCLPLESSAAYPSGHSTVARAFADVLVTIFPARKAELLARGDQIADDRALGGVHHPSDVEAGKRLGDAVAEALSRDARFRQDLKAVEQASED
jgi:acid phosphatase (class A)